MLLDPLGYPSAAHLGMAAAAVRFPFQMPAFHCGVVIDRCCFYPTPKLEKRGAR